MAADEEIVGRVRGVQRLAVQHRIQLHELGALQIVQHDVQAIARVVVDAVPSASTMAAVTALYSSASMVS